MKFLNRWRHPQIPTLQEPSPQSIGALLEICDVDVRYNAATGRSDGVRYENLRTATQIYDMLGFVVMRNLITYNQAHVFGCASSVRKGTSDHFNQNWGRMRKLANEESVLKTAGDVTCSRSYLEKNSEYELTEWGEENQVTSTISLLDTYNVKAHCSAGSAEIPLYIGDAIMWSTAPGMVLHNCVCTLVDMMQWSWE